MSDIAKARRKGRITRHRRVRKKISGTAARPRLAVHRSNRHITAQVIDDESGRTIAAASSVEPALRSNSSGSVKPQQKLVLSSLNEPAPQGLPQWSLTGAETSITACRSGRYRRREAGLEF